MKAVYDRTYSSKEVARITGATYRQLDYWTTTELISPSGRVSRGAGDPRAWTEEDVQLVSAIVGLVQAGVSLQRIRRALIDREVGEFARELSEAGDRLLALVPS